MMTHHLLTHFRQGEKPWQLLATCKELYAAMSGDPETFVSHVSVHQVGVWVSLSRFRCAKG